MANDFLTFAAGGGANVITQSAYAAMTSLLANGFQTGTAYSNALNKVWRQASIMSAVLAQFIVDESGQNAVDDGTTATLIANLKTSINNMIAAGAHDITIAPATFAPAVTTNGQAVYWDNTNSRFDLALADGTATGNVVGFADVTNSRVHIFGDAILFTGMAPGSVYYLSGSVSGGITATAPASNIVKVGVAKSATEMFVDLDPYSGILASNNNTFTKAQRGAPVVLPALTGSLSIDLSAANNFYGQVTGNLTFANTFTNGVAGQSGVIRVQQSGATPYNWAFGSYWKYVGGSSAIPSQTQTLGAYDEIVYYYNSATDISFAVRSDVK